MDGFTPQQQEWASSILQNIASGARIATVTLIGIDLAQYIRRQNAIALAHTSAENAWRSRIGFKRIGYLVLCLPGGMLAWVSSQEDALAQHTKFITSSFADDNELSQLSGRRGYWHTWLTSNFSHRDLSHLLCNFLPYAWFAIYDAPRMPQLMGIDIILLALGSSLSVSAAMYADRMYFFPKASWHAFGSSGIGYALWALTSLTRPQTRSRTDLNGYASTILGVLPCVVELLCFVMQHASVYPKQNETLIRWLWWVEKLPDYGKAGHTAHLAGAVFGAVYYVLFIRCRAQYTPEIQEQAETPEERREPEDSLAAMNRVQASRWLI